MTADLGGALPRRQMRALAAAGFRDWPSPRECPAYAALFPALCAAIDADGETHTPRTWTRFLAAVARCRAAITEGRWPCCISPASVWGSCSQSQSSSPWIASPSGGGAESLSNKDKGNETMPDETPARDFEAMLDLDRTTLTRNFVDRIEAILRAQEEARDDLKEILAEALAAEFRKHDIAAMMKIAKLRLQDKVGDAREQLAALERIGEIVGMPLFDWGARAK